MPRVARTLLAVLLVLASLPAAAADRVKIGIPLMSASFAAMFVAADKGYFKDEGIDPEFLPLSGGLSIPALIGGSIEISASPFPATVAILKGAPLKVILVSSNHANDQLWSFDPAVRSFADMKGKIVAIASRGNSEEVNIHTLLDAKGLPSDFVGFTVLGVGTARVGAILAGSQRYAMLSRLEQERLKEAGFLQRGTMLVDFTKGFDMALGGMATSDAMLAAHRDLVKRIVRAVWKGALYTLAYRDASLALLQKRFPNDTPDSLAADFDQMLSTHNSDGGLSAAAELHELAAHAQVLGLPAARIPPPAKVYDFSLLQEVKDELAAAHWQPRE
jgi:NitT/TauT family transport system substrate-binding protein